MSLPVLAPSPPSPSPTVQPAPHADLGRVARSRRTDQLVDELRECRDPERETALREELIALTMPVAAAIAQRYRSRGVPLEDLQQVAYLALTKAIQRYDAATRNPLLVFCVPTIRGEIRRYFRDHGWAVRPPRRVQELQARLNRVESELTATLGRTPSAAEVAEALGESIDDVLEARAGLGCFVPTSLDRPVGGERENVSLGDLLPHEHDEHGAAEARVLLAPAVRELGTRDREILEMRFVDGLTQREIADRIGVTQMQVSRLLTRIFRDLRRSVGSLDDGSSVA